MNFWVWLKYVIIFYISLSIVSLPFIFSINLFKTLSLHVTLCSKISNKSLSLFTMKLWSFFNLISHLTFEDHSCGTHSLGLLRWRKICKSLTITAAISDSTTSCSALSTSGKCYSHTFYINAWSIFYHPVSPT